MACDARIDGSVLRIALMLSLARFISSHVLDAQNQSQLAYLVRNIREFALIILIIMV